MPRTLNRLSARTVATIKRPRMYADGAGLYLRVKSETARSWVFVWHVAGKRREMGLGSLSMVNLGPARIKAQEVRDIIALGGDPVAARKAVRAIPTFGELADRFIEDRKHIVKSDKSVARWERAIGEDG